MVVTHLRNPVAGMASGTSLDVGTGDCSEASMLVRVVDVSNQNKHVIYSTSQKAKVS
jgi:hypothetical protein